MENEIKITKGSRSKTIPESLVDDYLKIGWKIYKEPVEHKEITERKESIKSRDYLTKTKLKKDYL